MKLNNIGGYATILDYIKAKLEDYSEKPKDFESLFEAMFSERDNVMIETSDGYRIRKVTYGSFREDVLSSASALTGLLSDAPTGALVGLYMSNSPDWIRMFWSILASGYRPLLMNSRLSDEILEGVLRDYSVARVISDGKHFSVPTVLSSEVLSQEVEPAAPRPFGSEVLFMSSGTTGEIKLCAYTGENFYYQICDSVNVVEQCPRIAEHHEGKLKQLVLLPLYHVFGFIAVYLWFGFFSRTFVFPKDLRPETIQNTVKKHKVTHIFAVPMVWNRVYKTVKKRIAARGERTLRKFERGIRISSSLGGLGARLVNRGMKEVRDGLFGDSIRFLISGGSHIDGEVLAFYNGIGYHMANGYGMTEVGITSVEKSSIKKHLNSGSIGSPFGNTRYSLSDEGHLLIKGKTMASRILHGGTERIVDHDCWFDTGDLVRAEGERYYHSGRTDDLVVSVSGENLNPELLEPTLLVEGCDELCLFADKDGNPVLLASVRGCYSADRMARIWDDLTSAVRAARLEGEIKRIDVTTDPLMLPTDFKVSRTRVRKIYADGCFNIIDRTNISLGIERILSGLEDEVIGCFAEALGIQPSDIQVGSGFFGDLGGTSLDYFTLLGILKSKYGVELPSDDGQRLSTVADFCDFIKNN